MTASKLSDAAPTISEAVELELQVCCQEDALNQLRADYAARLRRSTRLQTQLREKQANNAAALLRKKTEAVRAQIQQRRLEIEHAAMAVQDELSQRIRSLDSKIGENTGLQRKLQEMRGHLQQHSAKMSTSGDACVDGTACSGSPSDAQLQLQQKRQEITEMCQRWEKQAAQRHEVSQDLRNVLDFVMRSNIVTAGGPSRHLTPNDVFPPTMKQGLCLSRQGQNTAAYLVKKYEACFAETDPPAAPNEFHAGLSGPSQDGRSEQEACFAEKEATAASKVLQAGLSGPSQDGRSEKEVDRAPLGAPGGRE